MKPGFQIKQSPGISTGRLTPEQGAALLTQVDHVLMTPPPSLLHGVPSACWDGGGAQLLCRGTVFVLVSLLPPPRKAAKFQKDDLAQGFQP